LSCSRDNDATVYVLYDNRAAAPPAWLTGGYAKVFNISARSLVDEVLCADCAGQLSHPN
jgi:hypothetical protein